MKKNHATAQRTRTKVYGDRVMHEGLTFYRDANDEVRWHVVVNGRIVADSGEGYSSPSKARKGAAAAAQELLGFEA